MMEHGLGSVSSDVRGGGDAGLGRPVSGVSPLARFCCVQMCRGRRREALVARVRVQPLRVLTAG